MERQEDNRIDRTRQVTALTSYMVRKHYCENDPEALIALLDEEELFWQGAGEKEYAVEAQDVFRFFRNCAGMVPSCRLFEEEYHVLPLSPDIYLCSGHYWLETAPSTKMYLRVHQRITAVFRYREDHPRCCHLHISNPYSEMAEDETAFPLKMGQYSHQYLQEQLEAQAKRIQSQTVMLKRILLRDSLTGMFNRHKFNQALTTLQRHSDAPLGIAYFDLNGLKQINDQQGHNAGDRLLYRAAAHILHRFEQNSYRIGGDEFVVLEDAMDEASFRQAIHQVWRSMEDDGISCSVGLCWRNARGDVEDQFNQADHLMYQEKKRHYHRMDQDPTNF